MQLNEINLLLMLWLTSDLDIKLRLDRIGYKLVQQTGQVDK